MARFLLSLWPFPGHLHPNIAVAHALQARGHTVAFYTGASAQLVLAKEGFALYPFRHVDEARVQTIVSTLGANSDWWRHPRAFKTLFNEWLLGSVAAQIEDLTEVLDHWRADMLVCDPALWGPLLVLRETAGIPIAIFSYVAACMLPGRDGPITGLALPPARDAIQRAVRRLLRGLARGLSGDIPRRASRIRERYGLSKLRTTVTEFSSDVPLYLVPSAPEFDYDRADLPPSVRYVGPCLWDRPARAEPPTWVSALSRDRPLVYVTEGSLHASQPIVLRAALRGLADSPVQVVATTGKHRDPSALGLGDIPANCRVEQWVPHSAIFDQTRVVVTTGGTGTVLEALRHGMPLVVVPTAWDQPENAWRVAECGAGIRIAPGACTPERLREAVDQVLGNPKFAECARRMSSIFAQYGGPNRAAELLESTAMTAAT